MKYEEAMEKLEEITQKLEEGNLPLEETLQNFEEGMNLISFCETKLEEAEKKIEVLIKEKNKFKLKKWKATEAENEEIEKKEKIDKEVEKKKEQNLLFPKEKD